MPYTFRPAVESDVQAIAEITPEILRKLVEGLR